MGSILPVWLVPVAFVFSTLTYVVLAMYRSDLPLWQFGRFSCGCQRTW